MSAFTASVFLGMSQPFSLIIGEEKVALTLLLGPVIGMLTHRGTFPLMHISDSFCAGPVIGGYVTESYLGWRWVFWVMMIFGIISTPFDWSRNRGTKAGINFRCTVLGLGGCLLTGNICTCS